MDKRSLLAGAVGCAVGAWLTWMGKGLYVSGTEERALREKEEEEEEQVLNRNQSLHLIPKPHFRHL